MKKFVYNYKNILYLNVVVIIRVILFFGEVVFDRYSNDIYQANNVYGKEMCGCLFTEYT